LLNAWTEFGVQGIPERLCLRRFLEQPTVVDDTDLYFGHGGRGERGRDESTN
jgi:hypothetical protein